MTAEWHVSIDGSQRGPLTAEQIRSLAASGQLKPTDHIWKEGMGEWASASSIKGLFPPASPRPPAPSPAGYPVDPPEARSDAFGAARPGAVFASTATAVSTNEIDVRSLPLASKASLTWSFFWRGVLTTIASTVAGGLLGGVLGFVLGFLGFPMEFIQFAGGIVGLCLGVVFVFVYIQWLLTSRLGAYRLKLVPAEPRAR